MSAVENYIDLLQDRLLLTAPVEIESRAAFIKRVRRTLSWMNQNARRHARGVCWNQKKRAAEVLKRHGARYNYYLLLPRQIELRD